MTMTSNARKVEIYSGMLEHIQRGWVRRAYDTGAEVCLIGALNRVGPYGDERREIVLDLVSTIRVWSPFTPPEYNEATVMAWNDFPWRKQGHVVKVLQRRIRYYSELAKADLGERVMSLQDEITRLTARVAELEARNKELEKENRFLRMARERFTARDLRQASTELEKLDNELDEVYGRLRRLDTLPS